MSIGEPIAMPRGKENVDWKNSCYQELKGESVVSE